ncbi:small GTP-binding protein, putative [Trichomonas vaginalis G3]|uniref:Ras-related protein Rab-21 n=2 Tax=Trichomonas vaginalis TaxID=5722 RepID=A0A8U0WPF4_TRIV3|nr:small Rab GTPase RabF3 [Trichomonas vaginalis G3]AAX97478.1 small Rab GTPase RabF3 [Trichomonas vaginalis]EAY00308.1 small GTP-binding protein, putative [Trichomonas vaginalis G3]KAI5490881.1 small Rab GTPase RabF3 [Trichomonas vaginalis G3]|eukprot:XP_001313237.1 small GTP-binding protein [Trichomonas vaginalis G3]
MRKVKIVLVGAAHTGKTSIVNQYVFGSFTHHTVSTTQPAFCQKQVNYQEKDLSLEIWDTAGQERYHALSPLFYRDAEAGIVVFDLTDADSFTRAQKWINELKQARGDQIHIVIAGNKTDLIDKRVVAKGDAEELAAQFKAPYYETSAKTKENLEPLFNSICEHVVELINAAGPPKESPGKSLKGNVAFENEKQNKEGGCC